MGVGGLWVVLSVVQVAAPLVIAVALVVIAVVVARGARSARQADRTDRPDLLEQRLEHLDRLHAAGRITDDERGAARAALLGAV